ncbi:hypothetical protein Aperf_G00000118704 [Anoplocephala perfoliata]
MRFIDQFNGKPETSLLNVCGEEAFKDALSLSANCIGNLERINMSPQTQLRQFAKPRFKIVYEDGKPVDVKEFLDACGKIDAAIKGPYLCGDKVSLADMALAPFLNGWKCVLQYIAALTPDTTEESIAAAYPKFTAYRKMMAEEPYATATRFDEDEYCRFVILRRAMDTSTRY